MKKPISIILIFTMLLMTLSGCASKATVSQGVTDTTIKVGNAAATSGAFAPVGVPFNAGIQAYIQKVNDAGGIDGRKIEFVHYDDEFDPVKGKAFTEQLINDDKVFALVGHFGTPTIGATLDLLTETGIPTVYFAAGISALYNEDATSSEKGKGLYPVQPIYVTEGRLIVARAVEEHGAKKIGVIYTNDDAGKDLLAGVENQVKKLGDDYSVVKEQINPGAADVSSAVLKMKNENVDVVVAASIQATLPTIVKGLISQGVSKPVFTTYSNADATTIANFAADYESASNKFPIYSNAWVDLSNAEEVNDFVEGMTNYGEPDYAGNAFAMAGWIAGHFLCEGLKRTEGQTLNWENFMKAMESAEFKIPMGGTVNYANGQRLGTQAMSLLKVSDDGKAWESVKPVEDLNIIVDRVQ
ncbi:ABC transporter substrate-binding protein [Proteiniborus sp. MB09-C3]|uniref:ABC transporter substrate-binding protein n=1 Tax=Proteiniborus sp. MB09-C3 TaxID=3050072 RepID=UPI002552635F|nr:ABC transporter substrate-binding protein [Proteiniborus sp. MB09-C3]WIV12778.1 ABC transporter substrate-binding protein [Proteiniborus sp. MB09-C3]